MNETIRRILAQVAAGMTIALINQRNPQKEKLLEAKSLIAKNSNSLRESLGYIAHIQAMVENLLSKLKMAKF